MTALRLAAAPLIVSVLAAALAGYHTPVLGLLLSEAIFCR